MSSTVDDPSSSDAIPIRAPAAPPIALLEYSTCFPSARATGFSCPVSPRAESIFVHATAAPPFAATLASAELTEVTIHPLGLHVDPDAPGKSVTTTALPPVTGTFLICPPAQNPTQAPSGEKNGKMPSSLPATSR